MTTPKQKKHVMFKEDVEEHDEEKKGEEKEMTTHFSHVLTRNSNYIEIYQCACPQVTLSKTWNSSTCEVCAMAETWLVKQGVQIKKKTKFTTGETCHGCLVDEFIQLELPDTKGRASSTLKSLFGRGLTQFPRRHQYQFCVDMERCTDWTKKWAYGLLWLMGSGKTWGGIFAYVKHDLEEVHIIAPLTTLDQWAETVQAIPQQKGHITYRIWGYDEFYKQAFEDPKLIKNKFIILDEAHKFKNLTSNGTQIIQKLQQAQGILVLTGTPITRHCLREAKAFACLLNPGQPDLLQKPDEYFTAEKFGDLVRDKISYYDPRTDPDVSDPYPEVEVHDVHIPMSITQVFHYLLSLGSYCEIGPYSVQSAKSNNFHSRSRQVAICAPEAKTSPKIEAVIKNIRSLAKHAQLVYSMYKGGGVERILELVDTSVERPKLRTRLMTGDTKREDRDPIKKDFNNHDIDVLGVTQAGKWGVDLIVGEVIHLLEPALTKEDENQTIGRIRRQGSKVKTIHVYRYISEFPDFRGVPPKPEMKELEVLMKQYFRVDDDETPAQFLGYMKQKCLDLKETVDVYLYRQNEELDRQIEPYRTRYMNSGFQSLPETRTVKC